MDVLPTDLKLLILSFLSGEDVVRLKELNSTFSQIIAEHQFFLRRPVFFLYIASDDHEKLFIDFTYKNLWKCRVNYSEPDAVTVEPLSPGYRDFFGPLYKKSCNKCNLRTILDFLLEKGVVAELSVYLLRNPYCIYTLIRSIKNSSCQIREVLVLPENDDNHFPAVCDLLEAISQQKRQNYEFPKLKFMCRPKLWEQCWPQIRKLNEMAKLFKESILRVSVGHATTSLELISDLWRRDPFPNFRFHIVVEASNYPTFEPWEINTSNFLQFFAVTEAFAQEFLHYSSEDVAAFVRLEDLQTKNILQFHKRNRKCSERSVFYNEEERFVQTVDIRITASLFSE